MKKFKHVDKYWLALTLFNTLILSLHIYTVGFDFILGTAAVIGMGVYAITIGSIESSWRESKDKYIEVLKKQLDESMELNKKILKEIK